MKNTSGNRIIKIALLSILCLSFVLGCGSPKFAPHERYLIISKCLRVYKDTEKQKYDESKWRPICECAADRAMKHESIKPGEIGSIPQETFAAKLLVSIGVCSWNSK